MRDVGYRSDQTEPVRHTPERPLHSAFPSSVSYVAADWYPTTGFQTMVGDAMLAHLLPALANAQNRIYCYTYFPEHNYTTKHIPILGTQGSGVSTYNVFI